VRTLAAESRAGKPRFGRLSRDGRPLVVHGGRQHHTVWRGRAQIHLPHGRSRRSNRRRFDWEWRRACGPFDELCSDAAAGVASNVADTVRETASAAGDATAKHASHAADAASDAYSALTESASRAVTSVSHGVGSAGNRIQETGASWAGTVQDNISAVFERQPLLLGAVGIAIGASIAASAPLTETERTSMGAAARRVREAVGETAGQVQEAASAVIDEAKAQIRTF
jgi:hypothetical protein